MEQTQNQIINYVEIPNNIVWGYKDDMSLINKIKGYKVITNKDGKKQNLISKYKIIQIFYALYDLTNPYKNTCRFTIEGLSKVAQINNDKANFKSIKLTLQKCYELKLFTVENDINFEDLKINEWIELYPNYFPTNEKGMRMEYFKLYDEDFNKILSYDKSKINNGELLVLFCYYTARSHHREVYDDSNGNLVKRLLDTSNSEVCYPTYQDIYKDTEISSQVVKNYNDILVELGLILYKNAGNRRLQQADGTFITIASSNTIALARNKDAELEINRSIEAFISSQKKIGFIFVGEEKTKQDMSKKQISNTINRIQALEKKNGTLSKENLTKLNLCLEKQMENKVIENTSEESIKWQNKARLDNNKGKLLSDIFLNIGRYKEADKYLDIEVDLELVEISYDENGEEIKTLLIDWDYYKYVMVNYKENEHEKYFNSIKKYKRKQIVKENKKDNVIQFGNPKPKSLNPEYMQKLFGNDLPGSWGTKNPIESAVNNDFDDDGLPF